MTDVHAGCMSASPTLRGDPIVDPAPVRNVIPSALQLNYTAFADLANAVMGETLDPPFDPFQDDLSFLLGTYMFEDVGVSAYRVRVGLSPVAGHGRGYGGLHTPSNVTAMQWIGIKPHLLQELARRGQP